MGKYVLFFDEISQGDFPFVGGKGFNLAKMTKGGFSVPNGFCITTLAYRKFIGASTIIEQLFDLLDRVSPDDLEQIRHLGKRIREHFGSLEIPQDVKMSIIDGLKASGVEKAYAVRSSATAEDLPSASFAGQQDTYLNIRGQEQLLRAVHGCWASLFTDRAISYRAKNGFDHRSVFLSVVVQQMVFPKVSGIMFTADPVTGHRKTVSINASFGLGEALVSGVVTADLYQVQSETIVKKQISRKKAAVYPVAAGGTKTEDLSKQLQNTQALPDDKIVELAQIGRSIEKYFGSEQDIEWCFADETFYIVQSRPITSLYPVPKSRGDKLHLYISFGHPQMMTEAMKPLGISVLRTFMPFMKRSPTAESDFSSEAGGRIYLDLNPILEYRRLRNMLPKIMTVIDESMACCVFEFLKREEYQSALGRGKRINYKILRSMLPFFCTIAANILYRNHDQVYVRLNQFDERLLEENTRKLRQVTGANRIALIQEVLPTILVQVFKTAAPYIGTGMATYKLIDRLSRKWLGDKFDISSISKSPPGNVTTEMGLELGDLADAVRKNTDVIDYLKHAGDNNFLAGLNDVCGGKKISPVFQAFFDHYGARGTGEIDITRPRWREAPSMLIPAILSHIGGMEPGGHRRQFLKGQKEVTLFTEDLLNELRKKPGGMMKSKIMRKLIRVYRSIIGAREYPKYIIVKNFDIVKRALVEEGNQLVKAGILEKPEEIFWFSLQELKEIIENGHVDRKEILRRQERFQQDAKRNPPRVISSDGEIIAVNQTAESRSGSFIGSPVSSGIVEGRARVVLKLEEAKMEKGDILIAPYTDPAWTSLFPLAAGLVTETGGLMTHGAVVAREYGIPAVVGVENATNLIPDGATIRIDGTQGIVELLNKK